VEREFTVVVERDLESGWLVGYVVGLPGCHTSAPDEESLRTNILEAIAVYVEGGDFDDDLPEFVGTMKVRAAVPATA
jgi:predicted RNase H-like HicB family nuclease